jgi:hypothetical protein
MALSAGSAAKRRTQVVAITGGNFGDVAIVPSGGRGYGSDRPVMVAFHGSGSSANQLASGAEPYTSFLHDLSDRLGQPIYCVNTDSTWGNDAGNALVAIGVARAAVLFGNDDTAPICVGLSMGAATMFRYARDHAVSALVGIEPVTNLTDIHTNNRAGFTATINGRYGGAYSEGVYGATNNPATIAAAGTYDTYPVLFNSGGSDAICIPAEIAAILANLPINEHHQSPGTAHGFIVQRRFAKIAERFIRTALGETIVDGHTQTTDGTYTYDTFDYDGTYTAPSYPVTVDVLLVGGGGGGGDDYTGVGGGGGGGGEVIELTGVTVSGPEDVTVGRPGVHSAGSNTAAGNGGPSIFGAHGTALGGGGGGGGNANGAAGGCGGGGAYTGTGGVASGTGGNGANGTTGVPYPGGGGGGANNGDASGANGGAGKSSSISGTATLYGGGGGGGNGANTPGTGGGGKGADPGNSAAPTSGTDGLGGGGGGSSPSGGYTFPGWGGWGRVVVRRVT